MCLNKLPSVDLCGMTGVGVHSWPLSFMHCGGSIYWSLGAGLAPDVPSGRSRHPLSKFSTMCFLPPGRRTSHCHRYVSHSAARPWTTWGCYGSGKHWTGMLLGSFSHSHAPVWSCLWHTCVVCGEAVSEPPWFQRDISWASRLMCFSCCEQASLLPLIPQLYVILRAGLGFPRSHLHLPLGDQRPMDLVEILWGGSCPAVVENHFEPGEIKPPD